MVIPRLISLNSIQYLVHPQTIGRIISPLDLGKIVPAVLISRDDYAQGNYFTLLDRFSRDDDVFITEFSHHVIVQSEAPASLVEDVAYLSRHRAPEQRDSHSRALGTGLAQGPYFVLGDEIHQAWRLYPDTLGAFVAGTIPESVTEPSSFMPVPALSEDGVQKAIAVPSRLYSHVTPKKPLAGLRVSIKDNIDLCGMKTTLMNRAYTELYPPQQHSAPFVKDLIAKGAVIVGKTKLCSFASAEEPTDQWIDYLCPYNPRGDQYQSPSGSTAGGAASLAGFHWLDHSIGTDTTGSIRAPASCNGLYALRASHGTVKLDRVATRCEAFDTIGLLGRDLTTFKSFVANIVPVKDYQKFPKRLFYPLDFFPHGNENQQAMVMEFVKVIEDFMEVEVTEINIAERWMQCPPPEAEGKSVKEFLTKSAFWPMYYDLYHATDQFREDYREKFQKDPYVGPYVRWSWEMAKGVTLEDKERGLKEMKIFRDWFEENVFGSDPDTASDAVMIMPNGRAVPKYRDDHNGPPSTVGSYSENYIAAILELPQLIVPVGQNDYKSRNSGRLEHRPIVSSLVGAKGSDLMLINLAKGALEKAGWPTEISTGRYMFPLGDNLRNVAFVESKSKM